jgi:hypothetical protein
LIVFTFFYLDPIILFQELKDEDLLSHLSQAKFQENIFYSIPSCYLIISYLIFENSESGIAYFALIISFICTAKNLISIDLVSFRDFFFTFIMCTTILGIHIILFTVFSCLWAPFNGYIFIVLNLVAYFYIFYK